MLRPLCNTYEAFFVDIFPKKLKRFANFTAVVLSLVTGILAVYALIIMVAPQLYASIHSLWHSQPDKINQILT